MAPAFQGLKEGYGLVFHVGEEALHQFGILLDGLDDLIIFIHVQARFREDALLFVFRFGDPFLNHFLVGFIL